MRIRAHIFGYFCMLCIFGVSAVNAEQPLAEEVYLILVDACLDCHGPHGSFTENLVIDSAKGLIETGVIVPGKPNASEFYRRLISGTPEKPRMPLGPPLSDAAIAKIQAWILAGAPEWGHFSRPDASFIPLDAMLDTITDHVESLEVFDRASARYFTLTHLYNAGAPDEALNAYKIALSKLVNSLSWGYEIINPTSIDPADTIFYIDLRDYEWDVRNDAWTQIEQVYPYRIAFDAETESGLHEKLVNLQQEMACDVPFVHADWFLATASLPPLYHDILALPETDRQLENQLGIDVEKNLQSAPGVRVWRAGINDSGVSNHNRVVERHRSPHGAYWKSYDFAGSSDAQNIFRNPLTFRHDGGEVIFNLPNGLQAYYVSDASGTRIDEAPINIVRNLAASDPVVRNGLSCIGCHTEGMKTFEDKVRAEVEKQPASAAKAQALRLYVEKSVIDKLVAEDTQRYKTALEQTGGVFGGIEPVHRFVEAFQSPVDVAYAAAAVGLQTEVFLKKIDEKPSLQRLGLRVLESPNGTVKRDEWTANFPAVITALNAASPIVPIEDTTDDLRPTDVVLIPDVNLRRVIEAALGKSLGAILTAAEMARLTVIEADERGIRDLTGLEHARELERIEFRHNAISDLTPLSSLTQLRNIKLRGNKITDVAPLAKLVNVDWLGLEENAITDLSPLSGLVKLNGIGIDGNPVTDVSALAGMRSLEGVSAWDTAITDFSALSVLPRLHWIHFSNMLTSKLPSFLGLKNLRVLSIESTNISDISALAALTLLRELNLENTHISDVSPLAKLTGLKQLRLARNRITDVAPLKHLTQLEILNLNDNRITDVSPLSALTHLKELWLENNAISDFSPLYALSEKIRIRMRDNPGSLLWGGPKIVGPWVWVVLPAEGFHEGRDLLAQASGGKVTERRVATEGATEGEPVGNQVWTSQKIDPDGMNTKKLVTALGIDSSRQDRVMYGSILLHSHAEQQTTMFAGSDDDHKVWLNGELIN